MKRFLICGLSLAIVCGVAVLGRLPASGSHAGSCGLTTLDATLVDADGDGVLECGPGQPLVVREDLTAKGAGASPEPLLSFFTLADFQLADEESPLRGEWADKCGSVPTSAAFRPHETMVAHMLNAHVLAANRISASGGPVLGGEFDFAAALGDLADNQQYNEVRLFMDLLDGRGLVDPDSGAGGYEGVQGADPTGGTPGLLSPVPGVSMLDLANEAFLSSGLRKGDGSPLPWYSILGNHDVKVQGSVPDDNPAWRAFARAWVVGAIKVNDLAPDHQQELCADPSKAFDPAFWMKVASNPGTTKIVTPDPNRRLLDREQWIREHSSTNGIPIGHGFHQRCRDAAGQPLERGCYAFDHGAFRVIALDTNPAEGLEGGNIDLPQFAWLERELAAASARDKMIVVMTHHTISSTGNTGLLPGMVQAKTGADLEALLLEFPNVIAQVDGHTHQNKIWPHINPATGTGYWEINTSAIADQPHQSRTVEIADNGDGTLSIFAVVFDALGGPDARQIDWTTEDVTDEIAAGATRRINEEWLASAGREIGFNDPQQNLMAIGTPADRNVELVIRKPV